MALAVLGAGVLIYLARRSPLVEPAVLVIDTTGVVTYSIGSPDASLEVWVGSDYQCPDCTRYELESMPDIVRRFIDTGRIRWRYLLFALPGHNEAPPATHALACAQEQGQSAAGAVHRGLFETRAEWARSEEHQAVFRRVAEQGGLDLAAWEACMTSGRYAAAVEKSWQEAQRVGLPGPPTVLLYGRFYVGGLTANQLERVLKQ
jgi:protein-disulfide isomerase